MKRKIVDIEIDNGMYTKYIKGLDLGVDGNSKKRVVLFSPNSIGIEARAYDCSAPLNLRLASDEHERIELTKLQEEYVIKSLKQNGLLD